MNSPQARFAALAAALVVTIVFAIQVGDPNTILRPPDSEYTDLLITHWPNAEFFKQSVWRDHCWPLWNPFIFSGTPFAANPLSGVWYPPGWLLLLMPLAPGFNVLLVAHLVLGAIGAVRLIYRLQGGLAGGWVGPLVGGLAWGLAPKSWASLGAGHVGAVFALGWLPWIMEAAFEGLQNEKHVVPYRLPLFLALQFVADPRVAIYTGVALVALLVWQFAQGLSAAKLGRTLRAAGRSSLSLLPWIMAGLLAIGLSAVQWVPMAGLLSQTTRAAITPAESATLSLPVAKLVGVLWPTWGGSHEWMTYSGVGVFWLAFVGWLTRPKSARWVTALVCGLLVLISLGNNGPLYSVLVVLPGAELLRVPPRVWYLIALLFAVLAGLGADELYRRTETLLLQGRNLSRGALILLAFVGLFGLGIWFLVPGSVTGGSAVGGLVWGFVWLLTAVVVTRSALRGQLVGLSLAIILILLVGIDLVLMDSSLVERFPSRTAFAEDIQVSRRLEEMGGRIYAPSFRPSPHISGEIGLRIVNGVDPLQSAEYAQFLNAAAGVDGLDGYSVTLPPLPDGADPSTALVEAEPNPFLLSTLDVRGIVSAFSLAGPFTRLSSPDRQGELEIYRNESTIRWPVVYHQVEPVANLPDAIAALKRGRLEERAVIRGGYRLAGPAGYEPATVVSQAPNRLLVEAKGPGLLVVSEVAYPGWFAWVDGEVTDIYPTNGVLRGVYLSAGEHIVEMKYRPPAIFWGLGLSIVSLGGLAAGWWSRRRG